MGNGIEDANKNILKKKICGMSGNIKLQLVEKTWSRV